MQPKLQLLVILSICVVLSAGCQEKHVYCDELLTATGYRFTCPEPLPSEILVSYGKKSIGMAKIDSPPFRYSEEVESMDNSSITTKECLSLQLRCIKNFPNNTIKEVCLDFKTAVKPIPTGATTPNSISEKHNMTGPGPSDPTPGDSSGSVAWWVSLGLLLFIGIAGTVIYLRMKKRSCSLCPVRRRYSTQAAGNGHRQMQNMSSASDSHESGESNEKQDDATPSEVVVQGNGSVENGGPHKPRNLDHISCNGNGDPPTGVPHANGGPNHWPMERCFSHDSGHDPGGQNHKGEDVNKRIMKELDGRTSADRGPEDQEDEEDEALLSRQDAVGDEAGGLVNNPSGDPGPTRGSCTTAEHGDVESYGSHSEQETLFNAENALDDK